MDKHHLTVAPVGGRDRTDEIVLDIDGEQLVFSDDTFPSLPDFPCISSPSPTSAGAHPCFSTSPTSSSASSAWTFSKSSSAGAGGGDDILAPYTSEDAMVVPTTTMAADVDTGLDMIGDMDMLDIESMMMLEDDDDDDNAAPAVPEDLDGGGGGWLFSGGGDESVSAELAEIFLEWLKNNKDSISPEDLRSIKLKRSTIECAVRRLGDGKQGRVQLLKLILAWVQNSHLIKKRRRRHNHQQQQQLAPINYINNHHPNLDHSAFEPNLNSWIPYVPAVSFPPMMMTYANHPAGGDPPGGAVLPQYHFPAPTPNNNPFSLSPPEFNNAVDTASSWARPAHFNSAPTSYSRFPDPTSPHPLPIQYPGQQVYHQQGPHFPGPAVVSATKEARKRRMARQRRFSSHHNHSQQQSFPRPIVASPPESSPKSSLNSPTMQILPPSPTPSPALLKQQQLNLQNASSSSDRCQVRKGGGGSTHDPLLVVRSKGAE